MLRWEQGENPVPEFDLSALMQQAQAMQEKLKKLQEEAAAKTVDADAGGGMVRVTADGSMRLRRVTIDPALLAANDKEMLEDLIVVAANEALSRAQALMAEELGKAAPFPGLKLPGLFGGD
jgi:DNA-binding YbaB/EbfC family protein